MYRYAALLLVAACAHATVIFSTDGTPAPGFTTGGSWTASFVASGPTLTSVAMQFTAATSGTSDEVVAALSTDSVTTATFDLFSDAGGMPGMLLDIFTVSGLTGTAQLLSGLSMNHAALTASTTYWLELVAPAPSVSDEHITWYFASPPVMGNVDVANPVPTILMMQSQSAFALLSIPEPATLWLCGLGLLAALQVRLRKRQAHD